MEHRLVNMFVVTVIVLFLYVIEVVISFVFKEVGALEGFQLEASAPIINQKVPEIENY